MHRYQYSGHGMSVTLDAAATFAHEGVYVGAAGLMKSSSDGWDKTSS